MISSQDAQAVRPVSLGTVRVAQKQAEKTDRPEHPMISSQDAQAVKPVSLGKH